MTRKKEWKENERERERKRECTKDKEIKEERIETGRTRHCVYPVNSMTTKMTTSKSTGREKMGWRGRRNETKV